MRAKCGRQRGLFAARALHRCRAMRILYILPLASFLSLTVGCESAPAASSASPSTKTTETAKEKRAVDCVPHGYPEGANWSGAMIAQYPMIAQCHGSHGPHAEVDALTGGVCTLPAARASALRLKGRSE